MPRARRSGGPPPEAVAVREARQSIRAFSPWRESGGLIFLAGQGPVDMESGLYIPMDFAREAKLALRNLKDSVEAAGSSLDRVLQVTAYLSSMHDYEIFNGIYQKFFSAPRPARSCVGVSELSLGMKLEIDAIAERKE
jgi:2-iminobutanoate/2-iminopropanoate deaminase